MKYPDIYFGALLAQVSHISHQIKQAQYSREYKGRSNLMQQLKDYVDELIDINSILDVKYSDEIEA
jgi:hypothetical protein